MPLRQMLLALGYVKDNYLVPPLYAMSSIPVPVSFTLPRSDVNKLRSRANACNYNSEVDTPVWS